MTSSAPLRRRLDLAAAEVDLERFAWPALAVVAVLSALLIYHLSRGSSFSADDWIWIDTRRGNSLHAFFAPYNGHLSLVPIAIYRLMFALFGIGDFAPYRVLLVLVATATGVISFEYARHRVGKFCALLVATLLLFLGPGWNDLLQPFQIAWLIAVASGILALSLLDHRRPAADAAACLLILVSLSSTSVGVALAVGIAVDLLMTRRRWRDAWIVGLPLLLYVIWSLHYHPAQVQISSITNAPLNLVKTTASAVAGVVGLSGVTPLDLTGVALTLGISLLALGLAAATMRMRTGRDWHRLVSLGVALGTFSLLTTLARSFQSPFESRYMYVTCVLVTLMAVELARSVTIPFGAQLALAALTLVAVVSNLSVLRSGGGYLRQIGAQTDATLGAAELGRGQLSPSAPLTQLPLYPLVVVSAGQYFTAASALGTPAYSVAQLRQASPPAQVAADRQLLADGDVKLVGATTPPTIGGAPPTSEGAVGGAAARRGACIAFLPAAALEPTQGSGLSLQLAPGRAVVRASGSPLTVSVRRFAPTFTALGTVQAGGAAILTVARDRAAQPWHLQIQSVAPVQVCTPSGT